MRLKDILDIYHKELDELFGKNEVDSFFNFLIEHYFSLSRIHLVLEPEYVVTKIEEQPLFEALSRLKLEEPIQYIIGETEFYGLPFKVNKDTLIPRPETEELVTLIIENVTSSFAEDTIQILDIGTGSGCIAISLAKHIPSAQVSALDVSENALKIATLNAELNTVQVDFIHDSILNPHHEKLVSASHNYDLIVSNPPYVRNSEKTDMRPNVLNNEPHLALFVDDENPLQFYKAICEFAKKNLKEEGLLYFEINEYLGKEMVLLLKQYGFKDIKLIQDMYGKDRIVKGVNL